MRRSHIEFIIGTGRDKTKKYIKKQSLKRKKDKTHRVKSEHTGPKQTDIRKYLVPVVLDDKDNSSIDE